MLDLNSRCQVPHLYKSQCANQPQFDLAKFEQSSDPWDPATIEQRENMDFGRDAQFSLTYGRMCQVDIKDNDTIFRS
jgi:hypothetical protein